MPIFVCNIETTAEASGAKNAKHNSAPVVYTSNLDKNTDESQLSLKKTQSLTFIEKKNIVKKLFLHIFAIHSSSRHEKRCRMLEIIFCLFQCSRNC